MAVLAVQYRKPLVNIAYTFIEPFPVGLVFTLVCAGILRKRRNSDAGRASFGTSTIAADG
jgi:hypothetical protein